MRKKFIPVIAACAASLTLGLQAENSPGSTGASPISQDSPSPGVRSHVAYPGARQSAHFETRVSKLMGSEVKGSQGESLGRIEDVLVNPGSGRIDFAVLSLSVNSSSASSTSTSTPGSTTPSATASSSSDKLVPVPWTLLRPAGSSASAGSISAASSQAGGSDQISFTFAGDNSKLQAAPSFEQSSWPDVSQASWRQSVYSHYGVSAYGGASATGSASSPGGIGAGSSSAGSSDSSSTVTPGSSSSTPDSSGSTSPKSTDGNSSPSGKPQN